MFKLFREKSNNIIINKKKYVKPDIEKLFEIKHTKNSIYMKIFINHNIMKHFEYLDILDEFKDFNYRNAIIDKKQDFMLGDIIKQDIYVLRYNNIKYVIANSKNEIKISKSVAIKDEFYETTLYINKLNNDYSIGKYIHNKFKSTNFCKWYPNHIDYFNLDEITAKDAVKDLLDSLNNINKIEEILDLNFIKYFLKEKTKWDIFINSKVKTK